jgi:hypothetical protein
MDLKLNSDFDIELDQRNDVSLVDGREAFEQRLAIRSTAYFHELIGSTNRANLLSLLKVRAKRVAKDTPEAVGVAKIAVGYSDARPNTAEVTAIYETGDEFTFDITE